MSIELKLDSLVSKHNELENILSNSHELEHNEYARLSREFVELKEIVEVINSYRKKKVELSDLEIMASDQEIDLDIKKLANDELKNTKSMLKELEKDIQLLLLPKDEADEKTEIHHHRRRHVVIEDLLRKHHLRFNTRLHQHQPRGIKHS